MAKTTSDKSQLKVVAAEILGYPDKAFGLSVEYVSGDETIIVVQPAFGWKVAVCVPCRARMEWEAVPKASAMSILTGRRYEGDVLGNFGCNCCGQSVELQVANDEGELTTVWVA